VNGDVRARATRERFCVATTTGYLADVVHTCGKPGVSAMVLDRCRAYRVMFTTRSEDYFTVLGCKGSVPHETRVALAIGAAQARAAELNARHPLPPEWPQ
jgi:hypothetical protein